MEANVLFSSLQRVEMEKSLVTQRQTNLEVQLPFDGFGVLKKVA